ncbi:MAG: alkaline phosphatase family protein [Pseudomonadales bacterium]
MTASKIIQLEFNELCPPLMERFIAAGELPNFKALRDQSHTYITDAEERNETLEPWIQWITVHTGLSFEEHGIFNLGDAHKMTVPSVWDMLSAEEYKVWICGSMNMKYEQPINGRVLPDAWSNQNTPSSPELSTLCNFVRQSVQEHSNDHAPMSLGDYVKVLGFLVSHGLSFATVKDIAAQLSNELRGRDSWKRAVILDKLLWDVFAHYHRKDRPHYATFFSNSVAHFQHKFWRNMEPELFELKPSDEEQRRYKNAILFAYKETDKLVGKAMKLADQDTSIVFASALSQQPYLAADGEGGKHFYRPKDFTQFVAGVGLRGVREVAPVMSEEFHVYFESEKLAEAGLKDLLALTVNGRPLMKARREAAEVFAGCTIFSDIEQGAVLDANGVSLGFFDLFYQADSIKSGMHHPDGMLWVCGPSRQHSVSEEKLPLRSIAPAILEHFGVALAPGMQSVGAPIKF